MMTQKARFWFCFSSAFCLWAGSLRATVPVTDGLKFHVDASATETITMDAEGKVAQWNDLSGNGYPVLQSTESRKPVYHSGGLDGFPSLSFNGSNVLAASTSFINYSNHTVFVVAKATSVAGGDLIGSATAFSTVGDILLMANYNCAFRGLVRWGSGGTEFTYVDSVIGDQFVPMIYEQSFGNAALKIRRNGGLIGQIAVTNAYTPLTRSVSLGGRTEMIATGKCFSGEMSEVLIYDRELGMEERLAVVNYLKEKWLPAAVAISLPPVVDGLKFMCDAKVSDSLATNDTGNVSQWDDLTGNGYPVFQSTDSQKPVYHPGGLDGHPSLSFNGSNVLYSYSSKAFLNYSNHTVFVVAKVASVAGGDLMGSATTFSTAGDILLMANYNCAFRGLVRWGSVGTEFTYVDSVIGDQFVPMIYEQAFGNAVLKVRLNGRLEGKGAVTHEFTSVERYVSLGGRTEMIATGQCFSGEMSEVLIYDRELGMEERLEIINYLKSKWLTGAAAITLPPVVNGLQFMCDAKVSDSLTTNAAGQVSQWNELTGNGFSVAQSTIARMPVYHPAGMKGSPSLAFNGSNVLCSASDFVCYSNHTVFVVAKASGQTYSGNDLFGGGDAAPGSVIIMNNLRNDYQGLYFTEGSQYMKVTSTGASTLLPAVYEMWMDDSELRLYRDGVSHGSTPFSVAHTNTLKKVSLGNRQNGSPGGLGFIGEMSEVLVYDRALTVEERQQTETYLYEKWIMSPPGTVISLW